MSRARRVRVFVAHCVAHCRVVFAKALFATAFLATAFATGPAWAQSGGKFEITRSTLDAGGSTERSPDNLVVRGTIAQPDVGAAASGDYYLSGGFWGSLGDTGIFADGFESGDTSAWSTTVGAVAPVPGSVAKADTAEPGRQVARSDASASDRGDSDRMDPVGSDSARPVAPTQRGPK